MEKIKDKRFVVAVALATVLVVVLIVWRSASAEVVYPADRARVTFLRRVATRLGGFFHGAEAAAENARLRRELGALALARSDAEALAAENARLRAGLGFAARTPGAWIPAEVLSDGGGAAGVHRIVRLSKGSLDGVVRGAAVSVAEGLAGRVTAVTPHTCEVTLVTDPSVCVACEVETGAVGRVPRGIVRGDGGESLSLKYLTRAEGLAAARQRVVTSGLGGVFPRGILVGFLDAQREEDWSVTPAADLESPEFMFVRRVLEN